VKSFDFATDDDVLLDIDRVCKKLCISRSSLERLRRPAPNAPASIMMTHDDDFSGAPPFPEPTVILGRSPRWSAKALNAWIEDARSTPVRFKSKGDR